MLDLLKNIIEENDLTTVNIFNVHETGFSTVQKRLQKLVGLRGKKQVGPQLQVEKGEFIQIYTTAVCRSYRWNICSTNANF